MTVTVCRRRAHRAPKSATGMQSSRRRDWCGRNAESPEIGNVAVEGKLLRAAIGADRQVLLPVRLARVVRQYPPHVTPALSFRQTVVALLPIESGVKGSFSFVKDCDQVRLRLAHGLAALPLESTAFRSTVPASHSGSSQTNRGPFRAMPKYAGQARTARECQLAA
jgi:hypothetical protein